MYLTHPNRPGMSITVPDDQADAYLADGWISPNPLAASPVKPARKRRTRSRTVKTPKPTAAAPGPVVPSS